MAVLLGTTQPVVSDLMRGKLHKFSIERLLAFLEALDHDVEITVHPRKPLKRISLRQATAAR
jgi:predicted XRE-type DNA-binding protein